MNVLHDVSIEQRVLGQIIIEPDAFLKVSEILNPLDFYEKKHCEVYEAIQNLFRDNKGIDIVTVVTEAKKIGSDITAFEVSQLTEGIASAGHLEYHATIIKDLSVRRKLLKEIERLKQIGESSENTLDDFIDLAVTFVDKVIDEVDNRSLIKEFKDNIQDAVQSIQDRQKGSDVSHGLHPSLAEIRKFVPVWENGNLIIVAARPAMGKTAFAIHELFHISQAFGPVLYFSLEMSARELTSRILQRESNLSRYDFDKMTSAKWQILDDTTTRLMDLNFFIDDTPAMSVSHIKAKTKIFKKHHGVKAIAVDYLQLMSADKKLPREQQVAEISRNMKLIAKEFDIPVFLVAQLNRGPESRKEDAFRPKLSDLRESGSIEQDADIVIFPHRPSYYLPDEAEHEGRAEIIFAKNRHGKAGMGTVKVNDTITKFYDIIEGVPDEGHFTPVSEIPY